MVLYTDGLTEAPNAEEKEYGGARLADALRAGHAGSAKEINDSILDSVQRFVGQNGLRDDYTLLTVKRSI
jgi:sigma-B regulation protein RsbU (phosphoserine phosphatase)